MSRGSIISFCDRTGVAVRPFAQAGYDCWIVDLQHPRGVTRHDGINYVGANVHELHPYHRWLPRNVVGGFAWPECTHLAYSGQRWRRDNGPMATAHGFMLFAKCWEFLRYYEMECGAWWMIENPRGLLCSWCTPDHVFQPWQYGGNESKETCLWSGGGFVMPPPLTTERVDGLLMPLPATVERPADVSESVWRMAPGPDRANLRSVAPEGFARAVFEANSLPSPTPTAEAKER